MSGLFCHFVSCITYDRSINEDELLLVRDCAQTDGSEATGDTHFGVVADNTNVCIWQAKIECLMRDERRIQLCQLC